MGRIRRWHENMEARFVEGTFKRIEAVLNKTEDRTDFVREAVEREIERRENLAVRERTERYLKAWRAGNHRKS